MQSDTFGYGKDRHSNYNTLVIKPYNENHSFDCLIFLVCLKQIKIVIPQALAFEVTEMRL